METALWILVGLQAYGTLLSTLMVLVSLATVLRSAKLMKKTEARIDKVEREENEGEEWKSNS